MADHGLVRARLERRDDGLPVVAAALHRLPVTPPLIWQVIPAGLDVTEPLPLLPPATDIW